MTHCACAAHVYWSASDRAARPSLARNSASSSSRLSDSRQPVDRRLEEKCRALMFKNFGDLAETTGRDRPSSRHVLEQLRRRAEERCLIL